VTICVVLASTQYGWDLHIWDLTTAQVIASRKVSLSAQFLYGLATTVIRASIFTSYLRLALVGSWFRRLAGMSTPSDMYLPKSRIVPRS